MCDYPGCNGDEDETYFGFNLCEKHKDLMKFITDIYERISYHIKEA